MDHTILTYQGISVHLPLHATWAMSNINMANIGYLFLVRNRF